MMTPELRPCMYDRNRKNACKMGFPFNPTLYQIMMVMHNVAVHQPGENCSTRHLILFYCFGVSQRTKNLKRNTRKHEGKQNHVLKYIHIIVDTASLVGNSVIIFHCSSLSVCSDLTTFPVCFRVNCFSVSCISALSASGL